MFDQPMLGMDNYSNPEDIVIYDEESNEQNIPPTIQVETPKVVGATNRDIPEFPGDDGWCRKHYHKNYLKEQRARVDSICGRASARVKARAAQLLLDTADRTTNRTVAVTVAEVPKIQIDPNKHYVFKKGSAGTVVEVNYRSGVKMHRGTFYVTLHSSQAIDEHLSIGFQFDQKLTIIQKGQ